MSEKTDLENEALADTNTTTSNDEPDLRIIHQASCQKLSGRAQGQLNYQIAYSDTVNQLFLRIVANSSGGYFSKEWVPVETIVSSLDAVIRSGVPFTAPKLIPAFVSKSQNNAGFMAAVLLAEGVLEKVADKQHLLKLTTEGFSNWTDKWLENGTNLSIEQGDPAVAANQKPKPETTGKKPSSSRKKTD